ncbi:hypothetical protein AX16_005988 [Volvariella volvacea WC 439]|nr:hypothetical protein AX16_005988 [Volvariella volvacea WC 439]
MPPDLPERSHTGTSTPTRNHHGASRRETILSLVEMLLQQEGDSKGANASPLLEDDRDVPTMDEHLQVVGAEVFHSFQRKVNSLDRELRNFANAARQLGSSVAILSSAFHLRERLAQILFLYHENAADLFPRKITHLGRDTIILDPKLKDRRSRSNRQPKNKTPPHVARPIVTENLDPENFPEQLEALARDVTAFLNSLNEFPEFTDEAVNASILAFEGDLRYWASCLKEYQGQFRYPAVQRYIHDLTTDMGDHIDSITSTLSMFIEVGVPTIRFAQKHGATNLLNLSTVATFFSAVTATTLQFSFELDRGPAADSVNCFWFASLVFSIAAAVNSLLGLTWKQAMYRSPGHRVPWWVLIWIKRSPLVFLVMSVACFSIGLCCFTYATHQAPITSTITTVFTTFTSFGLAAVSAWFATERWIFLRHHGKKWLSDVLIETHHDFMNWPGMTFLKNCAAQLQKQFRSVRNMVLKLKDMVVSPSSALANDGLPLDATLPGPGGTPGGSHGSSSGYPFPAAISLHERLHIPPGRSGRSETALPELTITAPTSSPLMTPPPTTDLPFTPDTPTAGNGRQLWRNAVRNVKMRSNAGGIGQAGIGGGPGGVGSGPVISAPQASSERTSSSSVGIVAGVGVGKRATVEEPVKAMTRSRVALLVPRLKVLEPTQDLPAHQALVRHLQFSPDGRYLATSSWDRTSLIFQVADPFVSHRVLVHAQGFVGQVAWSPAGNLLLTKLSRGIKIWAAEEGVCKKTIDRRVSVESVGWFPGGEAFYSVEGSDVTKLVFIRQILDTYSLGRMKLHDVAITPDSVRLLGVGPLLESPTGLQPSKCKVEKRLVVYNMDTKTIEHQTPVLNDVRDITIAQNTHKAVVALVSYENQAPPQLWKLEMVKDRENSQMMVGRLTLRHTYMPKGPVDFAGFSYFGGRNNELVLCATKAGDVHIWDQDSGALLHHIRAQAVGGDLTCIAWNHAAEDPFMFATGSHDGAVKIWTKPADRFRYAGSQSGSEEEPVRSQSPVSMEEGERRDSGHAHASSGSISSSSSASLGTSTDSSPSPHPPLSSSSSSSFVLPPPPQLAMSAAMLRGYRARASQREANSDESFNSSSRHGSSVSINTISRNSHGHGPGRSVAFAPEP